MHFRKHFQHLVALSGSERGIMKTCPMGCEAGWMTPQPWSDCYYPIPPASQPQCYRSLKWRSIPCKTNSNACYQTEWETCLHKSTCYGQWSSWSAHSQNCSTACEGVKHRIRYCYLDGNIATGSCFGGGYNNNQTDTQECTPRDCIEGRTAEGFPLTPDARSPWTYTFYVTVILAALIVLFIIGLAVIKGRRYFKRVVNDHEQSTSFHFGRQTSQQPTSPTDSMSSGPNSPQQPPVNVYQTVEQETTSSQQNLFDSSLHQQRPRFQKSVLSLRKLPSLPRSRRNNARHRSTMRKKARSRISSSYALPIDARATHSTSDLPSTSSLEDITEPPYTRMNSFSAPTQHRVPVTRSQTLDTIHVQGHQRSTQYPAKRQPIADNWRSIHNGHSRKPRRFSSKKSRQTLSKYAGKSFNGKIIKNNELYKSSSILKQKGIFEGVSNPRSNTDYLEPIPCTCTPKCGKNVVHSYECVDFLAQDDGYVDCYVSVTNNDNYLQ